MRVTLALLVLILFGDSAFAQEKSWVGKTVLTKRGLIRIFQAGPDGQQVPVGILDLLDYRVLADMDGRIQVADGRGNEGWFSKTDAVLVDDAVGYFTLRIRDNPKDADAYSSRAVAWKYKGDLDNAIKDYDDALRLNPQVSVYNNRGIAWYDKKDYDKAIADFNEAIRLDPKAAIPYNSRGTAWNAKKDHDKAIADFTEAIRLEPRYANAYFSRGYSCHEKKEYNKAIADFGEAIRLNGRDAQAYRQRGLAWDDKKEHDKAIADYTEALRLDPKDKMTYFNRGMSWSDKKDYAKALADFHEARRLDPKYALPINAIAWTLATCPNEKLRDGKRAVEVALEGMKLNKDDAPMMDTLAAAYAEAGNFEDAVRWQQRALEDPQFKDDADARRRLELYRKKQAYRQD